ncbi:hypothetical protein LCGC14_3063830, partial [marine sediment metagenome]
HYAPTWVDSYASHHLTSNNNIQGRLAWLQQAKAKGLVDDSVATELERRQRLTEIQRGRLSMVLDDDGNLLPGALKSGALSEVKTVRYKDGSVGQSVKLHNPVSAIKEHNLMDGVYEQPLQVVDNRTQFLIVTSEKCEKLIARITERGEPVPTGLALSEALMKEQGKGETVEER